MLRDVRRVLGPGGRVLHEWSNGDADEEWVQIASTVMFEHEGVANLFHPGVRTEEEVEAFLAGLGLILHSTERLGGGH